MTQVTVTHAHYHSVGYGHKKIQVDLEFNGEINTFSATTNNMHAFDQATDLDGQDYYDALYELISGSIADQVQEWIDSI